ncbi:hypothetical protein M2444_005392 [Paenibacillus sp. PastF-3]|uniref:hypothetical protein n=1 Tax=Paenibacillus sp. PastF-3 TaxID=2940626 RepID=UPI00247555A4|nr:hypothetical protein [Paenibacillus sp. PastF-3]MDH6373560.1 hypothetical protein [Paenibacillus sp. PastF-3]
MERKPFFKGYHPQFYFRTNPKVKVDQLLLVRMRDFTPEESADYEASLNRLFKPTGRNLFDITPAPKEGTDWLNEESCARCGRNTPVEGYEWCSECRPDLEAKEEIHEI